MASELEVTTIRGLSSGADANKILVPSGHSLIVPGHLHKIYTDSNDPGSFQITSQSYVDSGLSITLTPYSASSKFHIFFNMYECYSADANSSVMCSIFRDGTNISDHGGATLGYKDPQSYHNIAGQHFDTPSTTSSINYKIRCKSSAGYPVYINGDNTTTYLTIMEELG